MHPALSVIFFTTLSGAGYGLLVWTAVAALFNQPSRPLLVSMLLALALITIGLLSSLVHLGQPQRAWRALSQWRTSWLSREGVASLATYLPALMLGVLLFLDWVDPTSFVLSTPPPPLVLVICAWLIASALATVACTAMIYASLKPIPAWRHRLVPPVYLLFALLCGGLLSLAILAAFGIAIEVAAPGTAGVVAIALAISKLRYWRDIDATPLPATRGDAVGLPARTTTVFERPHTEANYLTREMAFVVARQHAQRLRWLALVLFALVPMLCLLLAGLHLGPAAWLGIAALSALAGAFVERWLFFAEAKHLVTLYY
jgi:DMSO reductase anchor subunit